MIQEYVLKFTEVEDFKDFNWKEDYVDTLSWLHDLRYARHSKHVANDVVLIMVEACPDMMKKLSIEQVIERNHGKRSEYKVYKYVHKGGYKEAR
jgi:hypothetical protein